jgi:hypothetical protein
MTTTFDSWLRAPVEWFRTDDQLRAVWQEGPTALARLAALGLRSVARYSPPRKAYAGPGGIRPLEHLVAVFDELRRDPEAYESRVRTLNVRPDEILWAYERLRGRQEEGVDLATIVTLLNRTCVDEPPGKGRVSAQITILSFCAARGAADASEMCVSYLLSSFEHLGAFQKLEFRSADAVAALWPRRVEWRPLLYRVAAELLLRKARQVKYTYGGTGGIWAQVQATCGVKHVLWELAGEQELIRFAAFASAWRDAETSLPERAWRAFRRLLGGPHGADL